MQYPKGISMTIGITIMSLVIVAVGVAIFFVYQSTQNTNTIAFEIKTDDRLVIEQGQEQNVSALITSPDATNRVDLVAESSAELAVVLAKNSVTPGESFSFTVAGTSATEAGTVTIVAEQAGKQIRKEISVRVFSLTNTNTLNANTNTTNVNAATNTNTSSDFLRVTNSDLNFSMVYPSIWGEAYEPTLVRLAPTTGSIKYIGFKNFDTFTEPGLISVVAASADYVPTEWVGTPLWFSGTINPNLSKDLIMEQIRNAGLLPIEIEIVELDGRKAVKMYGYRGLYDHFVDVAYIMPHTRSNAYSTLMLLHIVESVGNVDDTEEVAIEKTKDVIAELKAGTLSEQTMRRYQRFEDAVRTFEFLQ